MEKFRGDLLKVLTSLDQRLVGLETHTDTLAQQVGELHRAGARGVRGGADGVGGAGGCGSEAAVRRQGRGGETAEGG